MLQCYSDTARLNNDSHNTQAKHPIKNYFAQKIRYALTDHILCYNKLSTYLSINIFSIVMFIVL